MNNKIEISDKCLSREEILKYKAGNLSGEELRRVEMHIIDCPLCSDAVEGAESISAETIANDFAFVKKRIDYKANKGIPKFYIYSAVAALLLIAVTALFNISQPSNNEQIFNKYFVVYPDVTVHKRDTGKNSKLTYAMNYYNLKKYKKAISIFSKIASASNNETADFYSGVSLMALNNIGESVNYFKKISTNKKNDFYFEANWYAALGLISLNKTDEAKIYLSKLNNSSDYREKANEILNQLSKKN